MTSSSFSLDSSPAVPRTQTAPLSPVFPLLAAVTTDAAATAAIRITQALARECGAIPTVLRVMHEDLAMEAAATGAMHGVPQAALDPAYRTTQIAALEDQVRHVLDRLPSWRYEVEIGATVPTIVDRARQKRAELVVLGLPQHNFFRRAFVRDTVRGVVEQTNTAVLAIRPELTYRPQSILVAVDFGRSSLRAAHLACQLVAPGGRVILAYVQPDVAPDQALDATRRRADGMSALDGAFMALTDELASQKVITITSVVEHGNSIEGIKALAHRMQPDVVALGGRHHSVVDWFFGDSVSADLVNDRQWSLLVVPE